jgi:ABC-2 type transport system permease protein
MPASSAAVTHRMVRAWRVALRLTALNLRARLQYRGEFLISVILGVIWQSALLVFLAVLFTRFPGMGGWPKGTILLIAGMRLLSHAVYGFVFSNIFYLPFIMREGRVDAFLLRPLPVYRQVLLDRLHINVFGDLLVAVALFLIALQHAHLAWTPARVVYLVVAVIGGAFLEGGIFTALSCAAFRFPSSFSWTVWIDEILGTFGNYPLSILPALVTGVLTFFLPVAFIAYFPAAVLTGQTAGLDVPRAVAVASPLVGLAVFLLARLAWSRSIRYYQGAGGS